MAINFYDLQQAIDYALINNPNLQIMQDRIGQAQAQLGEALASFYPQFKARFSYEHSDNPSRAFGMIISQRRLSFSGTDFNHPGGTDNYRPEVTASYSLFRDSEKSKRIEHQVDSAEKTVRQTHLQIENEVKSAYLKLKEALARLNVTAV